MFSARTYLRIPFLPPVFQAGAVTAVSGHSLKGTEALWCPGLPPQRALQDLALRVLQSVIVKEL